MAKVPCPKCGAPGGGAVCAYCGAAFHAPGDERGELAALKEYHDLVEASAERAEQCSRLIAQGYIPAGFKPLVEAGMHALARLDLSNPIGACQDQWTKRLELIATKLRAAHGEAGEKAAREFEAGAKGWREADSRETRNGCIAISVLAGVILYLAWWALRRFF